MKKSTTRKGSKPKTKIKEINLQGSDFILSFENCSDSYSEFPHFNACSLYLPKTVNKGKHNERTEFKWDSSPTTENAIQKIIFNRIIKSGNSVFKNKGDEGLALFFSRYKQERKKLLSLFEHTDEEWMELLKCENKSYNVILE